MAAPILRAGVLLALVSILVTLAACAARADVVTLQPIRDNTLYEDVNGAVSNGSGDHLFTGQTDNGGIRRAVLAFDVAGTVPAGSTIDQVTLTLFVSRTRASSITVRLHRLTAAWGEGASHAPGEEGAGAAAAPGDATWLHTSYPTGFWTTMGGDYAATESAQQVVGKQNQSYAWTSAMMAADVQSWLDAPAGNHGWILIGNESQNKTAKRFDSRENPTVNNRPRLQIVYTPSVVSGACCLPADSCVVTTSTDCATQGGVYQGDGTSCFPDPCVVATGACCFDDGTCSELSEADCLAQSGTYQGDGSACAPGLCPVDLTPFVDALPRPAVAVPVSGAPGDSATYQIAMTEFTQKLHRDLPPTRLWGYAGGFPGPTIEAWRDRPVTVHWINDLRDSTGAPRTTHFLPVDLCMHGPDTEGPTPRTVVHLHGGHVQPEYDGYPEDTFLPGQQATYVYGNRQLPATLWYHDHAIGITRLNVMMGLAGIYLLRDSTEQALGLPSGEFEVPLAIQDRKFLPGGRLDYPASWQEHFFGDVVLVNGKVWPYLEVKRGKYRFRLLNGSNSRVYRLTLSTGDPFTVIGTEGGLLPAPVRRDTVTLTPGERLDVIVDFAGYSPNTEILLVNDAPAPFPGSPGIGVIPDVMKFVVKSGAAHTDPIPATLRPMADLPESVAVEHRDFELEKIADACAGAIWTINGLHWDDITEFPVLNTTEVWSFINRSGTVHPMHMHLVMFKVLDRQAFEVVGGQVVPIGPRVPPDSSEAGWKDTAPVHPNEILRVIARFEDYTGLYAYHCHILEHEDHEMMRQFQVVKPVAVERTVPVGLRLAGSQPNPFGPTTSIAFEIASPARVRLQIYDVAGRRLRTLVDLDLAADRYRYVWDGRDENGVRVRAGTYFLRLQAGEEVVSGKMIRVR